MRLMTNKCGKVCIKELSIYSVASLASELGCDLERAKLCIEVLTSRGVLKLKNSNDLNEYDLGEDAEVKGKYQFVYVGLVLFEDLVIIVYPKYMSQAPSIEKMRQIFSVIRKASGSLSEIAAISEEGIRSNDRLALMLTLLEMYDEYGIYSNSQREYATNGMGSIAWERTIERHDPYISNATPVYFDFETIVTYQDQSDFATRLQRSVLTIISTYLEESGLLELLALDIVELSDEDIEDFGDKSFIDYRLDQELGIQFVTWKQQLIKLLKRFVDDDEVLIQSDDVVCLGTSSFYHLWEMGCKIAFNDLLDKPLSSLGLNLNEYWKNRRQETLLSIVPRPKWYRYADDGYESCGDVATLIPDTIAFWQNEDNADIFAIIDAKYYVPDLMGNPRGVPGVESITKQHLYQAAYKRFVLDNGFTKVVNAFVVPTEDSEPALMGKVEFPDIFEREPEPFTNEVVMWALPAEAIWDCYLKNSSAEFIKAIGNADVFAPDDRIQ